MGNRAVITTAGGYVFNAASIGVYLHWNGGRDSVEAFLTYCKLKGYRAPEHDNYGWARLCQVIGNFFGGSCSIGIDKLTKLDYDNGDNGLYIIKDWEIVDRRFFEGREQRNYNLKEMLLAIDEAQPAKEQIRDLILSDEVNTDSLKVGDVVVIQKYDGETCRATVEGFGGDRVVNGTSVNGMPYTNAYGGNAENINNYIRTKTAYKVE